MTVPSLSNQGAGIRGRITRLRIPARRWIVAAAVLWFLLCLLWTAPAALFAAIVQRAAPLQLQAVSGSFWHGRAEQGYLLLNRQRLALGSVEWRLSPWSLLWLHPGAHITTDYGEQFADAHVRLSPFGALQVRGLRAAAPLQLAGHWLPLPARGLVALNVRRAELAHDRLQALQGAVDWRRASWQWSGRWLQLGNFHCDLQMGGKGQLSGKLEGEGNLAGSGELTVDLAKKSYSLQARLRPAAGLPEEFRQGAALMLGVQPGTKGDWQVLREGHW